MYAKHILCSGCGKTYPLHKVIFRCEKCHGSLEVIFDYKKIKKNFRPAGRPLGHLRYREFYPVKKPLTLGEGGTDLLRSRNLEKMLKLKLHLYFKNETENPTGSFKDRGSSVEVAKALEFGHKKVACATTGNMGASVAAYADMANMDCYIFTTKDTSRVKLDQVLAYGAKLYHVNGNYSDAAKLAEEAFKNGQAYLLGDYLYRREGTKSIGFEIAEQLPSADYVFAPVGNGTLISAIWKAFKEFKKTGLLERTPKIVGVQAKGCAPVYRAWKNNGKIRAVKGKTIAVAMECGDPLDGDRVLSSVAESKGFMVGVSDREILEAKDMLSRHEGLFAEPAGAASLAGLIKTKGKIPGGSRVVCLITGHGLKTPFTGIRGKAKEIGKSPKVLDNIFK
jgi:threonine synthase